MTTAVQPYPDLSDIAEIMDVKETLRKAVRAERAKLTPKMRASAAEGFARVVTDLPAVRAAGTVAAYANRASEPSTVELLERLARDGVRVLLPALGPGLGRDWAWYTTAEALAPRSPGRPPEPDGPRLPGETIGLADVVVVPALAVDTSGTRLGQGGGWYDRVLAMVRPGVPVIALVHEHEVYDAAVRPLPREDHDLRVDAVATPTGVTWLRGPATAAG